MTFDQGSQPPPGWGAPPPRPGAIAPSPYGWAAPPREHPNGVTILVLGILSIMACGVLGPFAWSMGNTALREMNAEPQVTWSNRGQVTAGRICGMVGTALLAFGIAWVILWITLFTSIATR